MSRSGLLRQAEAILLWWYRSGPDNDTQFPKMSRLDFELAMFHLEKKGLVTLTSVVPTDKYRGTVTWDMTDAGRSVAEQLASTKTAIDELLQHATRCQKLGIPISLGIDGNTVLLNSELS